MEIVDAHVNIRYPEERLPEERTLCPTFESRLAVLREAGVSRAVAYRNGSVEDATFEGLLETNRRIAATCEASGGMLIPGAMVQPALGEQACQLLRLCREQLGMRFVGEMFDHWLGFEWGTPEYWRTLECALSLRMIPLIHCQDELLTELGERFPEGRLMIAHLRGGADYEERAEILSRHPNMYLVISGGEIALAGAIKYVVHVLGADRVIFGSDMGATDPFIAVHCVKRSGLSEEQQALVFAGNFWRLWRRTEGG